MSLEGRLCIDRGLYAGNQIAHIDHPTYNDSGMYKCIGYGQIEGDVISNEVRLSVVGT
jgi:hypothetical protein